jgi:hypothetical protein
LREHGDATPGPQHNHVPLRLAPFMGALRAQIEARAARREGTRTPVVAGKHAWRPRQSSGDVEGGGPARPDAQKKHLRAEERDHKDIVEAHRAWTELQPTLDPSRLNFPDETWSTTNMSPTRGWTPKGERLHGHWNTTTFLCGLRTTGLVAPLVRWPRASR